MPFSKELKDKLTRPIAIKNTGQSVEIQTNQRGTAIRYCVWLEQGKGDKLVEYVIDQSHLDIHIKGLAQALSRASALPDNPKNQLSESITLYATGGCAIDINATVADARTTYSISLLQGDFENPVQYLIAAEHINDHIDALLVAKDRIAELNAINDFEKSEESSDARPGCA